MTTNIAPARDADLSAITGELGLKAKPVLTDGSPDWAGIAASAYSQGQKIQSVLYTRQAIGAYAYAQAVPVLFNADGTIASLDKEAEGNFRDAFVGAMRRGDNAMTEEAAKKAWQRLREYGRSLQRHGKLESFDAAAKKVREMAGKLRASARTNAVQSGAARLNRAGISAAVARQAAAWATVTDLVETVKLTKEQRDAWIAARTAFEEASRALSDAVV